MNSKGDGDSHSNDFNYLIEKILHYFNYQAFEQLGENTQDFFNELTYEIIKVCLYMMRLGLFNLEEYLRLDKKNKPSIGMY